MSEPLTAFKPAWPHTAISRRSGITSKQNSNLHNQKTHSTGIPHNSAQFDAIQYLRNLNLQADQASQIVKLPAENIYSERSAIPQANLRVDTKSHFNSHSILTTVSPRNRKNVRIGQRPPPSPPQPC